MTSSRISSPAKRKAPDVEDNPDEPILSHAEQRKQKKKQKLGHETTVENPNPGDQPGTRLNHAAGSAIERKSKHDSPPKRQNSVWVGNLAFKTTSASLKVFFDGVGEITRINMPMKAPVGNGPRENSGCVYASGRSRSKLTAGVGLHMSISLRRTPKWSL
jgi:RNA recognition motif-containing protein